MAGEATGRAQRAARSDGLRRLAGAGLVGYALLHLLVAWLALQLAWGPALAGDPDASPDQSGALRLLARSPGGDVVLWLLAAVLAGLCIWQAVELLRHDRAVPGPGRERWGALVQLVKTVGTAAFYGYLAAIAVRAASGPPGPGGSDRQTVRGVLAWPGGQLLVVAVGLVVVGIGVHHVQKGARSGVLGEIDLSAHPRALRTVVHRWIQVGFALKGVALVLVGTVMAWAAATFDPEQATGLDGALRAVAAEPHGAWGLTAVAVGLASFAVYCLARARHPIG